MQILIIANKNQKEVLAGIADKHEVEWTEALHHTSAQQYELVIDLLFENSHDRISRLKKFNAPVIINSVTDTLAETDESFARINGWNGFLEKPVWEGSAINEKEKFTSLIHHLGKEIEWLPDQPGFVAPRVIAKIIAEARMAEKEGVSSPDHIDTALKLGTNYPFGPFEWEEVLGRENVDQLLEKLA